MALARSLLLAALGLALCSGAVALGNLDACLSQAGLSTIKSMLTIAGVNTANNAGPMTIVAPSDTAVDRYCASQGISRSWFLASYSLMRDAALYSVWPGVAINKAELVDGQAIITAADKYVIVSAYKGGIGLRMSSDSSTYASIGMEFACGPNVMLVVDTFLVPDLASMPDPTQLSLPSPGPFVSLKNAMDSIDELSLLNGLFMASGNPRNILTRVADPGSTLTLFAPVDSAIDAVLTAGGISWAQLLSSGKMPMTLLYAAMEGAYPTIEALTQAQNPTSLNGLTPYAIYSTPEGQTFIVGYEFKARILSEPIVCGKSIMYLVDTYMLPAGPPATGGVLSFVSGPVSVQQAVYQSSSLTMLKTLDTNTQALQKVALNNENTIATFLAPSDDAIKRYLEKKNTDMARLSNDDAAVLKMVKSQVIPQLIHPDGWSSGMTLDALSISRLNIKVDSTGVISIKPHNSQPAIKIVGVETWGPSWIVYIVDDVIWT